MQLDEQTGFGRSDVAFQVRLPIRFAAAFPSAGPQDPTEPADARQLERADGF
jgi:hypothetical protein